MKRIWTRIHQMLQENFSTPFAKIGILVVILIPLLYGFLYLWAFWDPYGRIQNMPVAFVNLDEGGVKNGEVKNVGKELEDELRSDHNVQWYFTTAEDAQQGLQDKRCLLYTSPSPRDRPRSRMPSSA
jgi:putative membrane protein